MKNISIIGVGLIGGSLGMALKHPVGVSAYRITGVGRNLRKLKLAKKLGAVDSFTTDRAEGLKNADIVVICTPVDLIAGITAGIIPYLKPGAIITDAGSVKGSVTSGVEKVISRSGKKLIFVGAHPLAGTEKSGVAFSSGRLYRGACTVITQGRYSTAAAVGEVKKMWRSAGSFIVEMSPSEHDEVVSLTSHLPHIMAFALSIAVGRLDGRNPKTKKLLAGSFTDMTRIADSNPGDWAAICAANRVGVAKAVKTIIKILQFADKKLSSRKGLAAFFTAAKYARQKLLNKKR